MSIDEQHIALPKLYGAPAYGRPPRPTSDVQRPFDPDELPLEAHRTEEEQEFVELLPPHAFAPGGITLGSNGHADPAEPEQGSRSFSVRGFTGRLLGRD